MEIDSTKTDRSVLTDSFDPHPLLGGGDIGLMAHTIRWSKGKGSHYFLYPLLHPVNLFFLLGISFVGVLVGMPWLIPIILGADLLLVLALFSRSKLIRKYVDLYLQRVTQLEAEQQIHQMQQEIDTAHRSEFEELARLVADIYHRHKSTAGIYIKEQLKPSHLLWSYLRLAVLHKRWSHLQSQTDREDLRRQIEKTNRRRNISITPRVGALIEQRIALLEKRLAQSEQNIERLNVIQCQMDIIGDLLRLLHAHSMTPASQQPIYEELERYTSQLEASEPALHELAEFESGMDAFADAENAVLVFEQRTFLPAGGGIKTMDHRLLNG